MRAGQCEEGTELGGTEGGSESVPSVPFELVLNHDLYTPNRFPPEGERKVWLIARLTPAVEQPLSKAPTAVETARYKSAMAA